MEVAKGKEAKKIVLTKPFSIEGESDAEPFYRAPNLLRRLLSLLKNLPPVFNLPKSQLQCYGESVYCTSSNLLSKCNSEQSPVDRFTSVVAWSISTTRPSSFGVAPYNPILGETHHVSKGYLNVLLEQVSVNPPVSALHATDEKENIEMIWWQQPVPKFRGTSIETEVHGKRMLKLLNHGETYEMNCPRLSIRILPVPRMDWVGNVNIRCPETGLVAEISYTSSYSLLGFGGNRKLIKGKILDPSLFKVLYEVDGHWDKTVQVKDTKSGEIRVIYDAKEVISGLKTPIIKNAETVNYQVQQLPTWMANYQPGQSTTKPVTITKPVTFTNSDGQLIDRTTSHQSTRLTTKLAANHKGVLTSESAVVWGELSEAIMKNEWEKAREEKEGVEEREKKMVSHHPPVSALHATDYKENIEIIWCNSTAPKFTGTSVEVHVHGIRQSKLHNHGETYEMNSPNLLIRIFPVPGVDWIGNVTIRCIETGLVAELSYVSQSFFGFGTNRRLVKGKIFDSLSKKILYKIEGHWESTVTVKNTDSAEVRVIYDAKQVISGLQPPIVKDPESVWPAETAHVWSELSEAILSKEWGKAKEAKKSIEERQRELRRERESKGENWVPKHFTVSYSKEKGWNCSPIENSVQNAPIISL
ncbi:hypothetical protein LR48_Vigan627s001300 [Vigna angularis]|uniref:Oxysterol-binding protein n=2 Tax=Phaseolus angularis TaxID=3914 RepID=A0A0L9TFS9_PHAAN|nr:hypothetical protein LR48_Vigan627s001300 [Vigna angularis]